MFFIFNKEKIMSYVVALSTVVVLFTISLLVNYNQVVQVSANTTNEKLPIYCVEIDENKVALTMNCAWSQLQMG